MKPIHCLLAFVLFLGLTSCESGKSLEKYYVEKSENPDFLTIDVSSSIINADPKKITAQQAAALERVDKLNILMFKRNAKNMSEYKAEKDSVRAILKGGKYQELTKYSSGKNGASINMKGKQEDTETDEFVVNAYSEDTGFAVVRLLGDDMTMDDIMAIMSLLKDSKMDMEQLKPLQDMLKKQQ